MRSSDFPSTVSPRLARAKGGSARPVHVAVVVPPGAMSSALSRPPLAEEIQTAGETVERLIQHIRQLPGIDRAMLEQGVLAMKHGLGMVAMAVVKAQ